MTPTTGSIQLAAGLTLPYAEQGDPSGLPVLLLHGYTDSLHSFDLLWPHLPASLRAIAITQRGHGDADRPAGGYRPEDYAGDALAAMDALGIEAAVIVGHSGGGYTAQRFALDHPERTLGLVLMSTFRAFGDNPVLSEFREAVSQLRDPVDPAFVREFQESCVAEAVPAGFLDAIVAESCKVPARVWKRYLEGLFQAEVPTESGTITTPTQIVWGDQDAFCRRSDQDALQAAIPGAELIVHRGIGHCPHWERPARTGADLAAFAQRLSAAPRTMATVA